MIIRQTNWLGEQRIDVPQLRAMESSVAADFDVLAGNIMSGRQALVVSGFKLTSIGVGAPVTGIQCLVAGGVLLNFNFSESGSIFSVPSNRAPETLSSGGLNPNVTGSWTANTTNYVGVDIIRSADSTTSDTLQFLNAQTLAEVPKTVPLARTLNYRFVIGTTSFSAQPNLAPLAQVVTNASNQIVSVVDARNLAFRVTPGGDFPAINVGYSWPGGRAENLTGDIFSNGDKVIGSSREWMQAAMTRIWEIGGGEYWYSATADRNVTMVGQGTQLANGEYFSWDGTNLTWATLRFIFDNSTGFFNDVAQQLVSSPGLTDLADGQCIYVDLDRTQNRTGGTALVAVKANLTTLGPGSVPGSRQVVAWRSGSNVFSRNSRWPVGTTFQPATTTAMGIVKLSAVATTPSTPIVISDSGGTLHGNLSFSASGLGIVWPNWSMAQTASTQFEILNGVTAAYEMDFAASAKVVQQASGGQKSFWSTSTSQITFGSATGTNLPIVLDQNGLGIWEFTPTLFSTLNAAAYISNIFTPVANTGLTIAGVNAGDNGANIAGVAGASGSPGNSGGIGATVVGAGGGNGLNPGDQGGNAGNGITVVGGNGGSGGTGADQPGNGGNGVTATAGSYGAGALSPSVSPSYGLKGSALNLSGGASGGFPFGIGVGLPASIGVGAFGFTGVDSGGTPNNPGLVVGEGYALYTGTNPASTQPLKNTQTPLNIVKAGGLIEVNTAGPSASVIEGVNIASVSFAHTGGTFWDITINFAAPIAGGHSPWATATGIDNNSSQCQMVTLNTTNIVIRLKTNLGADPGSFGITRINFMAMGWQ